MKTYSVEIEGELISYDSPTELLLALQERYPIGDAADSLAVYGHAELAGLLRDRTNRESALALLALTEGNADALLALVEDCPSKAHIWARQWWVGTRVLAAMFREELSPMVLRGLVQGLGIEE